MRRLLLSAAALGLVAVGDRAGADPGIGDADAAGRIADRRPQRPAGDPWRHTAQRRYRLYYPGYRHPYPAYRLTRPGYVFLPPYAHPYSYPYPYPYYEERYYIAPLYIPAEELYGPQAVARFLGWNTRSRQRPIVNQVLPPGNPDDGPDGPGEDEQAQANLRGTNQRAVSLGWKFIGFGDAHFANGKYSDAYERYRKAVQAAPQLAEGYFRQGYALAAMGRYELAAGALKRGLELDPGWAASGFDPDELYGDNEPAKTAHLDALAKAAEKEPHNADLMFLLGVYFHFDGEPEQAAVFFRRAAQLVGGNDAHLRPFLRK